MLNLVSSYKTWELVYRDSKPVKIRDPIQTTETVKKTCLTHLMNVVKFVVLLPFKLLAVLGFVIMMPIAGAFGFISGSIRYFQAISNQNKLIKLLTNDKQLEVYIQERLQLCEKEIAAVKNLVIDQIRKLENPDELSLSIPPKPTFLASVREIFGKKSGWENFDWDKFVKINLIEKENFIKDSKKNLWGLEAYRTVLQRFIRQKEVLTNLKGNERLEAIKRIAELFFVKNVFSRQNAKFKAFFLAPICLLPILFPIGCIWQRFFGKTTRMILEDKKDFLPLNTDLRKYKDLVDAHNQLIKNHDYLVPYIARYGTMNEY